MTDPKHEADAPKCELGGEPMPEGEDMFQYHGYSGLCPKPTSDAVKILHKRYIKNDLERLKSLEEERKEMDAPMQEFCTEMMEATTKPDFDATPDAPPLPSDKMTAREFPIDCREFCKRWLRDTKNDMFMGNYIGAAGDVLFNLLEGSAKAYAAHVRLPLEQQIAKLKADKETLIEIVHSTAKAEGRYHIVSEELVRVLTKERDALREALQSIAELGGMCLLSDFPYGDVNEAYLAGANTAFNQCAELAQVALTGKESNGK